MTTTCHLRSRSASAAVAWAGLCLLWSAVAGCGLIKPADPWGGADLSRMQLPVVTRGYAPIPSGRQSQVIVLDGKNPPGPLATSVPQATAVILADRTTAWRDVERAALLAAGPQDAVVMLAVLTDDDPPQRVEIPINAKVVAPREGIPSEELPPARLKFLTRPDGTLEQLVLNGRRLGNGPRALDELTRILKEFEHEPGPPIEIHVEGHKDTRWGDVAPVCSAADGSRTAGGAVDKFNVILCVGYILEEEIVEIVEPEEMPLDPLVVETVPETLDVEGLALPQGVPGVAPPQDDLNIAPLDPAPPVSK